MLTGAGLLARLAVMIAATALGAGLATSSALGAPRTVMIADPADTRPSLSGERDPDILAVNVLFDPVVGLARWTVVFAEDFHKTTQSGHVLTGTLGTADTAAPADQCSGTGAPRFAVGLSFTSDLSIYETESLIPLPERPGTFTVSGTQGAADLVRRRSLDGRTWTFEATSPYLVGKTFNCVGSFWLSDVAQSQLRPAQRTTSAYFNGFAYRGPEPVPSAPVVPAEDRPAKKAVVRVRSVQVRRASRTTCRVTVRVQLAPTDGARPRSGTLWVTSRALRTSKDGARGPVFRKRYPVRWRSNGSATVGVRSLQRKIGGYRFRVVYPGDAERSFASHTRTSNRC